MFLTWDKACGPLCGSAREFDLREKSIFSLTQALSLIFGEPNGCGFAAAVLGTKSAPDEISTHPPGNPKEETGHGGPLGMGAPSRCEPTEDLAVG